ncbi:MAG: hypothetical protein M3Z85_18915 [Acidobacteriota bacterium]|nr:hypothetical protein [Acidobacteriota bacterium]
MKRRLLLLNVALAALIGLAAWRLHQRSIVENTHEQAVLRHAVKIAPPPPVTPVLAPKQLSGSTYGDIAQEDLFAKDRNPTVVIEPPVVVPPKPMPPLPLFYGVMNLPSGPIAIMSEKPNTKHIGVHSGDKVGEFTVLALNSQQIEFEWDGKKIVRKVNELIDRSAQNTAVAPVPNPAPPVNAAPPAVAPGNPPAPSGKVAGIPAAAVATDDGSYRETDKDGHTWLYRQTPFGISKVEDKGAKK